MLNRVVLGETRSFRAFIQLLKLVDFHVELTTKLSNFPS